MTQRLPGVGVVRLHHLVAEGGGTPTSDFPDCVAIGNGQDWCCTGTLIEPNVVVTAAHCDAGGCCSQVFVGPDVSQSPAGEIIEVRSSTPHPAYAPPPPTSDVAVLVLTRDVVGVTPRALAPPGALAHARSVRVVGYGTTDIAGSTGYGVRRQVDVPLASDAPVGQDPETEFVAGQAFLDLDSCNGDSGGPAYVEIDGSWYLAGATSRAVPGRRRCGDGGIYSDVASFEPWIRTISAP